ncbi:MAG: protein rep, partial [Brevinema sp.]
MKTKKQEILKDTGKNGKDRKWKELKLQSLNLAEAFGGVFVEEMKLCGYTEDEAKELMSDKMFAQTKWMSKNEKVGNCAKYLEFKKTYGGQLKLYRAWFCKDRMCPMCSWRRAMKLSLQVAQILEEVKKREIKGRPIFATFSLPNVKGEDIGKSFSEYAEGFKRLMEYKEVKKYCLGAIRSSEVTYNENTDTYNTHIHCILWMRPNYFVQGYLSQKRWRELWTKATKMQHYKDPLQVKIKAIKPR